MKYLKVIVIMVALMVAGYVAGISLWPDLQPDPVVKLPSVLRPSTVAVRSQANHAPSTATIRDNSRLFAAVSTYDHIEELKPSFDPADNGVRRLAGLQKLLFENDYVAATEGDCAGVESAFLELKNAPKDGQAVLGPRRDLSGFKALRKRHNDLLHHTQNASYSNILAVLMGAAPAIDPLTTQDFMDACLYVGWQTSIRELVQDEVSHSGIIATPAFQKTVADGVADLNNLLNATRKVFEQRLAADYADPASVMDQLDRIQLTGVGNDMLKMPCSTR
jgi:hypothetical protein